MPNFCRPDQQGCNRQAAVHCSRSHESRTWRAAAGLLPSCRSCPEVRTQDLCCNKSAPAAAVAFWAGVSRKCRGCLCCDTEMYLHHKRSTHWAMRAAMKHCRDVGRLAEQKTAETTAGCNRATREFRSVCGIDQRPLMNSCNLCIRQDTTIAASEQRAGRMLKHQGLTPEEPVQGFASHAADWGSGGEGLHD